MLNKNYSDSFVTRIYKETKCSSQSPYLLLLRAIIYSIVSFGRLRSLQGLREAHYRCCQVHGLNFLTSRQRWSPASQRNLHVELCPAALSRHYRVRQRYEILWF